MGYHKLAVLSQRYPRTIILLWAAFFIFFGLNANKLPSVLKDHGLLPNGTYKQVQQLLSEQYGIPENPVILVFGKKDSVSREQFLRFIQLTLQQLHGMNGLTGLVSPLDKEGMLDQNTAYALLAFEQKPYEMEPVLSDLRKRLLHHNEISVRLTGKSVVQEDVNRTSRNDLRQAELIGLPATFIILWLAFGGLVSALIPLIVGVVGVAGAMGIMYEVGTRIELSNFVLNVIPMVGLALSIDFALLFVSRFREELEVAPADRALITTMRTAGRAVVFSSVCVFLGLMGTLFIRLPIFTSVAVSAMTVLLISVLMTLTLLPAILFLLRDAIQSENQSNRARGKPDVWHSWSLWVMKRPVRVAMLAAFVLFVCLWPLSRMNIAIPDAASLPRSFDSRIAAELYQNHFATPTTTHVYLVTEGQADSLNKDDSIKTIALTQRLERDPYVLRVDSVHSRLGGQPLAKPTNRLLLDVTLKGSADSQGTRNWLNRWEQAGNTSNPRFIWGGEAKYQQEVFDEILENIKYVVAFIGITNFLMLFIAFRSVLLPLKAIVMNFLSLGTSFGILVWVFGEGSLGMERQPIAIMIPVFIFGLVFGISMDYGVFLLSRISEVYRQTGDNDTSVLIGLSSTSRIITSAAAIMISVTFPFAFGEVVGVKQLGIGISTAILIDATIIRMVLVPSLMKMLGKWNWWAP